MPLPQRHLTLSRPAPPDLEAGRGALARGAWAEAAAAFERLLATDLPDEEAAEAREGIWWRRRWRGWRW